MTGSTNNNNSDDYTESQLQDALATLASVSNDDDSGCSHLHGFNKDRTDSAQPFFKDGHQLSMLQKITARRVLDYQTLLSDPKAPSEADLIEQAKTFQASNGPILNLHTQIKSQSPSMALAAEFKRASPSKGDIAPNLNAGDQALLYTEAGACTISVLTEEHWFKGSLDDLTQARLQTTAWVNSSKNTSSDQKRPAILRKDFCISTYMIAEAAAAGADTLLLIVAVTPSKLLSKFITFARSLGMEPLVEVHAKEELDVALDAGAKVIGVNNRNLHTFQMDLAVTDRTADELTKRGCCFEHGNEKAEYAVCALSGMSSSNDVDRYRQKGVSMCLIGESLMRATNPKAAIDALCLDPKAFENMQLQASNITASAYTSGTKIIKVCGITNPDDALVACKSGANLIGIIFAPKSKRCVSVEQAQKVVEAVRSFGERSGRLEFPKNNNNNNVSPLQSLITKSRAMEETSRRPLVVGVFQNQDEEFIRNMVDTCGLDLVQLHGKEGMAAANIEKCSVPAIRVVDIETNSDGSNNDGESSGPVAKILDTITTDPLAILLDTSIKGSKEGGGTGVTFDWSIAEKLQNSGLPVIIAGGLKPENVQDAVSTVRPWGIDVSSGVEASPGVKNVEAVRSFVKGARDAAVESSKGF